MTNKLLLKKSSVTGKVPLSTDLEYGELALNYQDGKLYYKKADNTISDIASSGVSGVTSVGGTGTVSGLTLSGTITTSGNLTLGGTLVVTPSDFSSQTANTFLAAPNGSNGTPVFRILVAADVPTLNQNTTGTASNVTGTVAIANGGTGQTGKTAAFDALSPTTTKGDLIVNNGTDNIRLPVGSDTFVLTADAAEPSGVKWAVGGTNTRLFVFQRGDLGTSDAVVIELFSGVLNIFGRFANVGVQI